MNLLKRITHANFLAISSIATFGALLLTAGILSLWGQEHHFTMPTNGMRPTIMAGDAMTANMRAYDKAAPQIGDLAIFVPPHFPEKMWVFRVVAVPGDALSYQNKTLQRNGVDIVSPAPTEARTFFPVESGPAPLMKTATLTLGPDEFFLLSDDPEHLNDSRAWGAIPRHNFRGRVTSHH